MLQLWQFALAGLAGGSAYALLSLGVVAVYRGSGILNFAQGAIGMMGGYAFWELYDQGNGSLPVIPAAVIGVLVGAALGVIFYVVVIKALLKATDMVKVVATLGLMLLLESLASQFFGSDVQSLPYITGSQEYTIFGAPISEDTVVIVGITVLLAVGLSILFNRTRFGMVTRALRENPAGASALGLSPHPTGITTWAVGGAMGAIAGIFLIPVLGLTPDALTLLVIPAMAAALVGRFTAIWTAAGISMALGIAESIMSGVWHINSGVVSSLPFAIIVIAVVAGGKALPGRGDLVTARLPRVGSGRISRSKWVLVVIALVIPLLVSPTWSTAIINSAIFGLLALSMVLVTGYAGQISLAAAALAGFGSFIAAQLSSTWNVPFLLCVLAGTAAAVVLGAIVGAPAVRVRGINLAIVTLGLSLAVEDMILTEPSLTGGLEGLTIHTPSIFGLNVSPSVHADRFAFICVLALVLAALAVLNIRRGVSGRRYLAVRANERGAASLGVSVSQAKLGAFAVSAALAGLSGSLATFQFQTADFSSYDVFQSITALAFTVVGGIGFVGGAIFAAVSTAGGIVANFFISVLHLTTIDNWLIILSGLFVIQIIIQFPDGAVLGMKHQAESIVEFCRARIGRPAVTHRVPIQPEEAPPALTLKPHTAAPYGKKVLTANDIRVDYGGVTAVDGVSLELVGGKVLGIMGPNGAGKTSLIDALSGFTRMSAGSVDLMGQEITGLRAFSRARLGLGRTFQNLELFDDMSVRENILAAQDGFSRAAYVSDLVHPGSGELSDVADSAVKALGLEQHLGATVADLPQGKRRMVAIARLIAQQPSAILLDEPAAGLSGSERRNACSLFRALADELGAAVLLVEHNVDVIASTTDELIVLDFGRVIAAGATEAVLDDPAVRAAYLGKSDLKKGGAKTISGSVASDGVSL